MKPQEAAAAPEPCPAGRGPEAMAALERWLQHGSTFLVGVSGVVYAWMRYLLPESQDPFSLARHPLQPTFLDIHVLAAPLFLLGVGLILRSHILVRLRNSRRSRSRRSGLAATLLLLPMIASGYLLQTATSETWRWALLLVHLGTGGAFGVFYLIHLIAGRLAARRQEHRSRPLAGPSSF